MIQDMKHDMRQDKKDGILRQATIIRRQLCCLLFLLVIISGNVAAQVKVKGNVYGGGNKAFVGINTTGTPGNTLVKLQGSARIVGNVYGGGNEGEVGGNSSVIFEQETPSSNPGDPQPGIDPQH